MKMKAILKNRDFISRLNALTFSTELLKEQWKAVCLDDNEDLSREWKDTEREAFDDGRSHREMGHFVKLAKRRSFNR